MEKVRVLTSGLEAADRRGPRMAVRENPSRGQAVMLQPQLWDSGRRAVVGPGLSL